MEMQIDGRVPDPADNNDTTGCVAGWLWTMTMTMTIPARAKRYKVSIMLRVMRGNHTLGDGFAIFTPSSRSYLTFSIEDTELLGDPLLEQGVRRSEGHPASCGIKKE